MSKSKKKKGQKGKGKTRSSGVLTGGRISVNVTVQPSGGKATSKKVTLSAGATLADALAAAGASVEGKNVFVGGKPGDLAAAVSTGAEVTVSERASAA